LLVVAVGPSFFNNNQRSWLLRLFLRQRLVGVAGWLGLVAASPLSNSGIGRQKPLAHQAAALLLRKNTTATSRVLAFLSTHPSGWSQVGHQVGQQTAQLNLSTQPTYRANVIKMSQETQKQTESNPIMQQIGVLNLRINDMMTQLNATLKVLMEENQALKQEKETTAKT